MISEKQTKILAFQYSKYDALLCDGAIRSGKTSIMTVGFIDWAMRCYNECNFAICGKTVGSAIKNVVKPYMGLAYSKKRYNMRFNRADNLLTIKTKNKTNYFYVYGGKDESSYMLIQGITLAGVLLDEVALMTRSFVEQALARCSVENSKFWFNCNPDKPQHWFYKEWVLKYESKNTLHLHFLMEDNPSLSAKMIERYNKLYTGVFHDRYIKGLWVIAEGLVFPMFNKETHTTDTIPDKISEYCVSMDYGILNPTAMLLWGKSANKWHCINEYYHSGRETNQQKTDDEYYSELENLTNGLNDVTLIIDPSASSFITLVRKKGKFIVRKAKNDVIDGIQYAAACLNDDKIIINTKCKNFINEFGLFSWNEKSLDKDQVIKTDDHAMDAFRYFCYTKKIIGNLQDTTNINPMFL